MTLHQTLKDQLAALDTSEPKQLSISEGGRELTCGIVEQGALAISFDELRLATAELADAAIDELERLSQALAKRLTYLLEPISPIETCASGCVVQMRSNPPQKEDDGRSYYELVVQRGGQLSLQRFQKRSGSARESVPATVTREVLLRLVADFCAALDERNGD